ncbi:hypothetical protein DFR70_121124 [Nocardia tenerifensis]|uniref:Uncharacterized protein n=1 Tax=Nocardia tenerifensis TaxID=228006 RepID=A0A318JSW0_9NOCA|nr:hypothetical protein [Nocardia tenerifensis]PXX55655.1 hypothetical protein DFR70_121124 [Nocardia tenerifensis]
MLRSRRSVAVALSSAAVVLSAPTASAQVTGFEVMAPWDPGVFVAGCTYIARVTTEPDAYLSFHDSQDGEFDPPNATQASAEGSVLATWTPHTTGSHLLRAVQVGGGEQTIGIEVRSGGTEDCAGVGTMWTDN